MKQLSNEQQETVEQNQGLVYDVVRKVKQRFSITDDDYDDDLVQAGSLGLINAAFTYDSERGAFSTYAWWAIQRAVIKAVAVQIVGDVRIPWSAVTGADCPVHEYVDVVDIDLPLDVRDLHEVLDESVLAEYVCMLTEPYRTIITRLFYEDIPRAQVARELGVRIGFVQRAENEALGFLRDRMETHGYHQNAL